MCYFKQDTSGQRKKAILDLKGVDPFYYTIRFHGAKCGKYPAMLSLLTTGDDNCKSYTLHSLPFKRNNKAIMNEMQSLLPHVLVIRFNAFSCSLC